MLKQLFIKKALESQLKQLPESQRERILEAVSKNPDLFTKIAKEVQEKIKQGKPQQAATMEVMMAHQDELKHLLS